MRFALKVKDRTVNFRHIPNLDRRRQRVFDELDATHFQALVTFVAGIGFFVDGYNIFAVGMIIPVLAHVYWHGEMPSPIETGMRAATLIGTVIGQLGFGVLADMYGRRKMYGFELLIVAIATVGVAMAANGASGSMSLVGWLVSWRFIMGVGIGGDYPLSAVITSEFAPTRSRARMIATVFYMQPCGYLVATVIAIFALLGHKNGIPQNIPTRIEDIRSCTDDEACRRAVDSVWRWVIGIGAIPAVIAMFFRFTIPESPRYTLEVLNRPEEALQDINAMTGSTLYPSRSDVDVEMQPADAANGNPLIPRPSTARESRPEMAEVGNANPPGDAASEISTPGAANDPRAMSTRSSVTTVELQNRGQDDDGEDEDAHRIGMGLFCFDFAFYALGPNSYKVVSKIFNEKELRFRGPNLPLPMRSIYTDLLENSWHSLVIVSIGSMLGGLCMIKLVKRISPRKIQIYGFLGLALLFVVIGILFHTIPRDGSSLPIMALLYIVSQFFFEVGPNFTTFMLPAELFPTRFRCTAHGISAAAGKVASVLVQVFAAYAPIGRHRAYDPSVTWLGWVVIIFAMFMILGAGLTKWLIPETRLEHGENQPLEDLEDKAKLLVPVKRRQRAEPTEDEVDAAIEQPGTVAANEPTTQS